MVTTSVGSANYFTDRAAHVEDTLELRARLAMVREQIEKLSAKYRGVLIL